MRRFFYGFGGVVLISSFVGFFSAGVYLAPCIYPLRDNSGIMGKIDDDPVYVSDAVPESLEDISGGSRLPVEGEYLNWKIRRLDIEKNRMVIEDGEGGDSRQYLMRYNPKNSVIKVTPYFPGEKSMTSVGGGEVH